MKKLIIVAAVAFVATIAQASAITWGISTTRGTLDATKFASGTAYFIAVSDLARPTSLTDETAGEWYKNNIATVKSSALLTGSVADGAFYSANEANSFDRARQNYWLFIDNGATTDADHYFAVSTINKGVTFNSSSQMTVTATWNAGQMTTYAAVPEPTSGLMLLLGIAGLALKRKRA